MKKSIILRPISQVYDVLGQIAQTKVQGWRSREGGQKLDKEEVGTKVRQRKGGNETAESYSKKQINLLCVMLDVTPSDISSSNAKASAGTLYSIGYPSQKQVEYESLTESAFTNKPEKAKFCIIQTKL